MAPRTQAFHPIALDAELAARLREALASAQARGGPGASVLREVLNGAETCSVVLSLTVGPGAPAALLLQVQRRADPLATWIDLSCI